MGDRGDGPELGVGFHEATLQVLFPLSPQLCLLWRQTVESLEAILNDPGPEHSPQFTDVHPLSVTHDSLGIDQTDRLNQVTVSNADRYVYSNSNAEDVRLFLSTLFFDKSGPVRRNDHQPIGSAIQ